MYAHQAVDIVRREFDFLGYAFFGSGAYNLNIIGVRAAIDQSNLFDDMIVVLYRDEEGTWVVERFQATTDPGRPWLVSPMRASGCAIVAEQQARGAYALGEHHGKPALRQVGNLLVYRDNDKDDILDMDPATIEVADPSSGINMHRAGGHSRYVEKWSAGCQVFALEAQFDRFLVLCRLQAAKGNGWDRFTYTLVSARKRRAFLEFLVP